MQLHLTIENGATTGPHNTFVFEAGTSIIGRGKTADWILSDNSNFLSARHCKLTRTEIGFVVTDISKNGAMLNGHPLVSGSPSNLSDGDLLELGPHRIRSRITTGPVSMDTEKTQIAPVSVRRAVEDKTVLSKAAPYKPTTHSLPGADGSPSQSNNNKTSEDPSDRFSSQMVSLFAQGANIDPDLLAGRNDTEFARELGQLVSEFIDKALRLSMSTQKLRTLIKSDEKPEFEIATDQTTADAMQALFGVGQPGYLRSSEVMNDILDDLSSNDAVLFETVQVALFKLLNELSPIAVEKNAPVSLLKSKDSRNWQHYVRIWENYSESGENGLLDVFLAHLRDAYDARIQKL